MVFAEVINITWDGVQGYTTAGTGTEKQGKPELNADMVRDCRDGFADGQCPLGTWMGKDVGGALVQPLPGKPGSVVGS